MRCKFAAFAGTLILPFSCFISVEAQTGNTSSAPVATVKPVIDDYHGVKVSDPYRYMEKLDDPPVQEWFKRQNDYARAVLSSIPGRQKLLARIEALDQSVPRVFAQPVPNDVFFVEKLLPGENVSKLYKRNGLPGQDELMVDPEDYPSTRRPEKGQKHDLGLVCLRRLEILSGGSCPGRFRARW
jgi:hypothetical protein